MKRYFVLLDSLEIRFIGKFSNSLEAMDFYEEVFGANDRDKEDSLDRFGSWAGRTWIFSEGRLRRH